MVFVTAVLANSSRRRQTIYKHVTSSTPKRNTGHGEKRCSAREGVRVILRTMVRKASLMELHWTRDLEEEREGAIQGFTRTTFKQEEEPFPSPSGGTGTYVQSRIIGGVHDPSSSFTPHIQPNGKSWWLDLQNIPHMQSCLPTSTARLLSVTLIFPWMIIETSQLEVPLFPFVHTHTQKSALHAMSNQGEPV